MLVLCYTIEVKKANVLSPCTLSARELLLGGTVSRDSSTGAL